MAKSLRKGRTSVYLQHEHTGHSIAAEKYESRVGCGIATLKFDLKPIDGNQKHDEEYLHTKPLVSVTIDDDVVIKGFISHVKSSKEEIKVFNVVIHSRNNVFEFDVEPKVNRVHRHNSIIFTVLH